MPDIPYHISRSSTLTLATCRYKYWVTNLWGRGSKFVQDADGLWRYVDPVEPIWKDLPIHPGGLQRASSNRHLAIGATMHAALEYCLRASLANERLDWDACLMAATSEWLKWEKQGWAVDSENPNAWTEMVEDYKLQAMALVWLTYHRLVPALLAQYEVVLVEEEERVDLGDNFHFNGRADAVLRPHANAIFGAEGGEGLVVLSAKSVFRWTDQDSRNFSIDAQGYTEPWLLQQWLRRTYPAFAGEHVSSIQFLIAIKGMTTTNKELGYKYNAGPLTHPYMPINPDAPGKARRRAKAKVVGINGEDAPIDEAAPEPDDPTRWWPAWVSRRADNTTKTLSSKYKRVRASEYPGGQIAWIEHVAAHHPEVISACWTLPPPVLRSAESRERYVKGLYAAHWQVSKLLDQIERDDPTFTKPLSPVMELYGFQRTLSPERDCYMYNAPCLCAKSICYRGNGAQPPDLLALRDPFGNQLYVPRQPHHPEGMGDEMPDD